MNGLQHTCFCNLPNGYIRNFVQQIKQTMQYEFLIGQVFSFLHSSYYLPIFMNKLLQLYDYKSCRRPWHGNTKFTKCLAILSTRETYNGSNLSQWAPHIIVWVNKAGISHVLKH